MYVSTNPSNNVYNSFYAGSRIAFAFRPSAEYDAELAACAISYTDGEGNARTVTLDGNDSFAMPAFDTAVELTFQPKTHTISWNTPANVSYGVDLPASAQYGQKLELCPFSSDSSKYVSGVKYSYTEGEETVELDAERISAAGEVPRWKIVMPKADITVTPVLREKLYVLTSYDQNKGDISVDPSRAEPGETITVQVSPNEGYTLGGAKYKSEDRNGHLLQAITGFTESEGLLTATFAMPDEDIRVYVEFDTPWEALQRQLEETPDGGTVTLSGNVTARAGEEPLIVGLGRSVTIDLNGYSIDRNLSAAASNGYVIKVLSGALTITGSGQITGGNSLDKAGGILVSSNGSLTLAGGSVTGNTAGSYGGGVYVDGGSFAMTGGSVTGNTADANTGNGGGVYLGGGSCTVSGGSGPHPEKGLQNVSVGAPKGASKCERWSSKM